MHIHGKISEEILLNIHMEILSVLKLIKNLEFVKILLNAIHHIVGMN